MSEKKQATHKVPSLASFRAWQEMLKRLTHIGVPMPDADRHSKTARHRKSNKVLRRRKANKAARLARRRNR